MLKIAILGDIAIADIEDVSVLEKRISRINLDGCDLLIANLEGVLVNKEYSDDQSLWNVKETIKALSKYNLHLTLANNHILDIPKGLVNTVDFLMKNNVSFSGVSLPEKEWFDILELKGRKVGIFPACWHVLLGLGQNEVPIIDVYSEEILNALRDFKTKYVDGIAIVLPHWCVDFEQMPFPRDRKLAAKWIDNGADIIAGSHSHVIQRTEYIANRPVTYSLGNFLISNGKFRRGAVTYSENARRSLVNLYSIRGNSLFLRQEIVSDNTSVTLIDENHSPISNWDYLSRRTKKLLPMMISLNPLSRKFSDELIKLKIYLLKSLISNNLYNWKRH